MNKTTTTLIILILLALGAWAVFGSEKYPDTTVPEPVVSKDGETIDTSEWVTYRNEEMGFEVKYPESLGVHELSRNVTFGPKQNGVVVPGWSVSKGLEGESIEDVVSELKQILQFTEANTDWRYNIETRDARFMDVPAIIVTYTGLRSEVLTLVMEEVYFMNEDRVWSFPIGGYRGSADYEQISYYQGLIDTFKFINSSE